MLIVMCFYGTVVSFHSIGMPIRIYHEYADDKVIDHGYKSVEVRQELEVLWRVVCDVCKWPRTK